MQSPGRFEYCYQFSVWKKIHFFPQISLLKYNILKLQNESESQSLIKEMKYLKMNNCA